MMVANDPTQPVLLLARGLLLVLSTWIGVCTITAVLARAFQWTRAVEAAARYLPGVVRSVVLRSLATPVASAGLVGSLLLAQPASAAKVDVTTTSAVVSVPPSTTLASPSGGDVTNGQRWPAANPAIAPKVDPDAPVLQVPGPVQAIRSREVNGDGAPSTAPLPKASISTTQPAVRPTSTPTGGVLSVPANPVRPAPTTMKSQASTKVAPVANRSGSTPRTSPSTGYVVRPGDHFWSIAEQTVRATKPGATEEQVHRYWVQLVEANLSKLHDRSNPDLLHVGTHLSIPPVPN